MGFAFISFKDREMVIDTIEEIDMMKQELTDKRSIRLGIKDWKVERACPPTDIIWSDIQNISVEDSWIKRFSIKSFTIFISFVYNLLSNYIDTAFANLWLTKIFYLYLDSFIMATLSLFVFPWIVFQLVQWETNSRKSIKEVSFLSKHGLVLVFTMIMSPWVSRLLYKWFKGKYGQEGLSLV
jgi:hypothetical protein